MRTLLNIFTCIAVAMILQACQPLKTTPEMPPIVNDDLPPDVATIHNTEVINQEMSNAN